MAEYTGIALQTVDAGQNVVLTETPRVRFKLYSAQGRERHCKIKRTYQ